MKKFSKILEDVENSKFFKVTAQVELLIPAETEGEASYIADYTISDVKNLSDHNIFSVEETTKEYMKEHIDLYQGKSMDKSSNKTPEEEILSSWDAEFGERMPTSTEKLEFYHNLRSAGFDGILIQNILKDKLLGL